MKKIIVLISVLSSTVFAQTIGTSRTVAKLASVNSRYASVQLKASGDLAIVKRDNSVQMVRLNAALGKAMLEAARTLGKAETETTVEDAVCAMRISPSSIQNLSVYDPEAKEMKIVLSYESCALSEYTFPKESSDLAAAKTLKVQMLTLVQQLAK